MINASSSGTRDVNNTCNVLHIPRASKFNTDNVLNQIVKAQGLLASGASLTAETNGTFADQSGVAWLGNTSSNVLACSWDKDIDGVVGALGIELKSPHGVDYLDTIAPGDILIVFMDDAGDYDPSKRFTGTFVTAAIVDRVAESTRVDNGATVSSVSVSGRDLAVVLSESATVFDQSFAQIENGMYTGEWMKQLFGDKVHFALNPTESVFNLLLLLFNRATTANDQFPKGSAMAELQWKLSPSGTETQISDFSNMTQVVSLFDVTTYVQNPMPFYAIAKPPAIVQAGNVWSLLAGYANTTLNEFFIDVRDNNAQERNFRTAQSKDAHGRYFNTTDGPTDEATQNGFVNTVLNSNIFKTNTIQTNGNTPAPTSQDGTSSIALVFRQRPYSEDMFNVLPTTVVDSTEVESLEVSRSSHDVINWFRLRFPDLDVKLQEFVAGIRIAPQSIAKFGFRRMDAETIYMFTSNNGSTTFSKGSTKTDFSDVFLMYMDILSDWFSQNEFWLSGQMTTRFMPKVRIGTRIQLRQPTRTTNFYVQGVQHRFSKDPGGSRSTFTITRGRRDNATIPTPALFDTQHNGLKPSQPQEAPSVVALPSWLAPT